MFSHITFYYDHSIVKGILLGEYELLLPWLTFEKKKFLFFSYTTKKQTMIKRKEFLVFVPWKHALKEITCVDESMVISKENTPTDWTHMDHYTSKFDKELPYISEFEVENFYGYSSFRKKKIFYRISKMDIIKTHSTSFINISLIYCSKNLMRKLSLKNILFLLEIMKELGLLILNYSIAKVLCQENRH